MRRHRKVRPEKFSTMRKGDTKNTKAIRIKSYTIINEEKNKRKK